MNKPLSEMTALELMTLARQKREEEEKARREQEEAYEEERISALEKEFEVAYQAAASDIASRVKEATILLKEAVEISEKYSVPFMSYDLPDGYMYVPESFEGKFGELESETIQEITGEWYQTRYTGWLNSSSMC